jgi:predicted transcriptional regulator
MQGIICRMTFFPSDTCRERARRLLNTTDQPLTADTVAAELGTTRTRAGIVLRELERQGAATRTRGGSSRGGRLPDQWTATR